MITIAATHRGRNYRTIYDCNNGFTFTLEELLAFEARHCEAKDGQLEEQANGSQLRQMHFVEKVSGKGAIHIRDAGGTLCGQRLKHWRPVEDRPAFHVVCANCRRVMEAEGRGLDTVQVGELEAAREVQSLPEIKLDYLNEAKQALYDPGFTQGQMRSVNLYKQRGLPEDAAVMLAYWSVKDRGVFQELREQVS